MTNRCFLKLPKLSELLSVEQFQMLYSLLDYDLFVLMSTHLKVTKLLSILHSNSNTPAKPITENNNKVREKNVNVSSPNYNKKNKP